MKSYVFIVVVLLAFLSSLSLEAKWARTYGGVKDEEAHSVQQVSSGGYIVAGQTDSFGAGRKDFWVLKLSADGTVEWERTYGGDRDDIAHCIRQTEDGGYIVAGQTDSFGEGGDDYLVIKLNSKGHIQWQKTYGGKYHDRAISICQSNAGGYLVGGHTASFGAGMWDFWVLKLDVDGNIQWHYTYGGKGTEYLRSIRETYDGGYILAGTTATFFKGLLYNFWVVKIAADGMVRWEKSLGGFESEWGYAIDQTEEGGYIVAGDKSIPNEGPYDFWVLKLSPTGKIQWQYTYGKAKQDIAFAVAQYETGGYMVSGLTESSGLGNGDIWVLKLDSEGKIDWQRTYGGNQIDRAQAMDLTDDGGCLVAGGTTSYGAGGNDVWILKLDSEGNIDPSCGFVRRSNVIPELGSNALEKNSSAVTTAPSTAAAIPSASSRQTAGLSFLLCEAPQYYLTIMTSTGGSTQPDPGIYIYYKDHQKRITAIPDAHHAFSHWSGNIPEGDASDNPITLRMDRDRTVTAHFQPLMRPPLEFSAYQVMNRSLSQAEFINILSWKTNPANTNIAAHRIYVERGESQNILAEIPVSITEYWHRNVEKDKTYVYAITAVDANGYESTPLKISINQCKKRLRIKNNIIRLSHSELFSRIPSCVRLRD